MKTTLREWGVGAGLFISVIVFMLGGWLIFLGMGMHQYSRQMDSPAVVQGILIEASVEPIMRTRKGLPSGYGFTPQVLYSYEVNGQVYQSRLFSEGSPGYAATPEEVEVWLSPFVTTGLKVKAKTFVGFKSSERWTYMISDAPIQVFYSPENPEHAVLKLATPQSNATMPLMFGSIPSR